ncbi:cytochrome P450 [Actinoplanes sp. NPDC049265]|uniref:cytochrome P450 n=1 Tax=Actinoplanes sp. NPDC049265 TaxID=3363902 RepID=UPI003710DC15
MRARSRDRLVYLAAHPFLFTVLAATRHRPTVRLGGTLLVHDRQAYVHALTRLTLDRTAEGTTGGAVTALTSGAALFDQQGQSHRTSRRTSADPLSAPGVEAMRPTWTNLMARALSPLAEGAELDLVPLAAEIAGITALAILAATSPGPAPVSSSSAPTTNHLPARPLCPAAPTEGPPSHSASAQEPSAERHRTTAERHNDTGPRASGAAVGAGGTRDSRGPTTDRAGRDLRAGPADDARRLAEAARAAAAATAREHLPGLFRRRARDEARLAAARLTALVAPDGGEHAGLHAMLAVAAINTTVAALPRAAAWSADDRLWDAARRDPAALADELLRVIAPTPLLPRAAAGDGELPPGGPVHAGDRLMLIARHAAGAHRSGPDPARPAPPQVARLVFGVGPHACPGARLARIQLADWLAALAPYRPVVTRARPDRRSALPGWRSLTVRAGDTDSAAERRAGSGRRGEA